MKDFRLVGKIKGLAAEVKRTKTWFKETKVNSKKWWIQRLEVSLGIDTRHHLLAYAFIKNKPYHELEAKCSIKPNPNLILKIVQQHSPIFRVFSKTNGKICFLNLSDELMFKEIEEWLNGEGK